MCFHGNALFQRERMPLFHILLLLSKNNLDGSRVVNSYKRRYVHKVLVNRLVKLAQEKVKFGELTISQDHSC